LIKARLFTWTQDIAAKELYLCLDGKALDRVNRLPLADMQDAGKMIDTLDGLFLPPNYKSAAYQDFKQRRMKPGQTLRTFVDDLMTDLRKAKPLASDEDVELEIKEQLANRIHGANWNRIVSFFDEDLDKIVRKYDSIASFDNKTVLYDYDKSNVREDGSIFVNAVQAHAPTFVAQAVSDNGIAGAHAMANSDSAAINGSDGETLFAMYGRGGYQNNRGYDRQGQWNGQYNGGQGQQGYQKQPQFSQSGKGQSGPSPSNYQPQANAGNSSGQGGVAQSDNSENQNQNNQGQGRGRGRINKKNLVCGYCFRPGHPTEDCFIKRDDERRQAFEERSHQRFEALFDRSNDSLGTVTRGIEELLNYARPPPKPAGGGQ